MREIKFRGSHIHSKEWIYGYLSSDVVFDKRHKKGRLYIGYLPNYFDEIIPETAGQYTGLKDKNKKEIFEGDVVKDGWDDSNFGQVTFNEGGFNLNIGYIESQSIQVDDCEVIGNICENPELLEKYILK